MPVAYKDGWYRLIPDGVKDLIVQDEDEDDAGLPEVLWCVFDLTSDSECDCEDCQNYGGEVYLYDKEDGRRLKSFSIDNKRELYKYFKPVEKRELLKLDRARVKNEVKAYCNNGEALLAKLKHGEGRALKKVITRLKKYVS